MTSDAAKAGHKRGKPPYRKSHPRPKRKEPVAPAVAPAGLDARRMAVALLEAVLRRQRTFEEALAEEDRAGRFKTLEPRDRGFATLIARTVLRRHGTLSAIVAKFIERPLPPEAIRTQLILLSTAAQVVLLETPVHAAIHLAVEHAKLDATTQRFSKLVNAVARRIGSDGPALLTKIEPWQADVPDWMRNRWAEAYGAEAAQKIAAASLEEAALDITVRPTVDPSSLAEQLAGHVLTTGSIRCRPEGPIDQLPGFSEGAWWVQDTAASLPARLVGAAPGDQIADLCAAPGGKTLQLAAMGAHVVAIDQSALRLQRLQENLERTKLAETVETQQANVSTWQPARLFDAVLLDAPCTATGTIRRHPDILRLRTAADITRLAGLQAHLLKAAAELVRPGGRLVYCTCSLEPEEGPMQAEAFLAEHPMFAREPITADMIGGMAELITAAGDLRTLPSHNPGGTDAPAGMDGFYAVRLRRLTP